MGTVAVGDLGVLQTEYKVSAAKNRANLMFGRLFVVLGPLLLLYGLYGLLVADSGGLNVLCGAVGLILLLMGAFALWEQGRDRGVSVRVHEQGLVYERSGKTDILPWDDIDAALMSILAVRSRNSRKELDMVYGYTLARQDGSEVNFRFNRNSVRNIDALSDTIQQEVTRRKLPQAIAALNAGEAVQFGKLSVDRRGIDNGKEHVSWTDIEEVKVEKGTIAVRKKGKWLSWTNVAVGDTPNVFVFLALVDGVVKQRPDLRYSAMV